jgi:hypothetical protein
MAETDITEKLDSLITQGLSPEGHDIVKEGIAEIERLRIRVAELEARLEVDHDYVSGPDGELIRREIPPEERQEAIDGIECRDASISTLREIVKLKTHRIAELEAKLVAGTGE